MAKHISTARSRGKGTNGIIPTCRSDHKKTTAHLDCTLTGTPRQIQEFLISRLSANRKWGLAETKRPRLLTGHVLTGHVHRWTVQHRLREYTCQVLGLKFVSHVSYFSSVRYVIDVKDVNSVSSVRLSQQQSCNMSARLEGGRMGWRGERFQREG